MACASDLGVGVEEGVELCEPLESLCLFDDGGVSGESAVLEEVGEEAAALCMNWRHVSTFALVDPCIRGRLAFIVSNREDIVFGGLFGCAILTIL